MKKGRIWCHGSMFGCVVIGSGCARVGDTGGGGTGTVWWGGCSWRRQMNLHFFFS